MKRAARIPTLLLNAALCALLCVSLCSCSVSLESVLTRIKNYVNNEEASVIPEDFVESRDNGLYAYDAYRTYAVITGYLGEEVNVTVPAAIDGLPVKKIAGLAFYSGAKVEKVTLPTGLTELDENAFYYCTELKSVKIPDTVTKIGGKCFSWCTSLKSISLPSGLTVIPEFCFNQCASLEALLLPKGVTYVGARAFSGCVSLRYLDLGEELLSLGTYAFRGDAALEWVRIPGNCNLGENVFADCGAELVVVTEENSACALACQRQGIAVTDAAPPEESREESGEGGESEETSGEDSGLPDIDIE